ncbi:MAG TPA: hypothetical protein VE981_19955 [Planctomycetota bacterium]|nr:hypothetical protein [Planctomycetota bacterium]
MPEAHGWKLIAIPLGGLALLGVLIWQCVRFWMLYSKAGGTGNLAGGVVCALLIVAWLVLAFKMLM